MRSCVLRRRVALVTCVAPLLVALCTCRPPTAIGTGPDAAIVAAATWVAWLAAGYLLAGVVVAAVTNSGHPIVRALVPSALAAVVAAAVGASGVAAAATTMAPGRHPRPPALSLDWPVGSVARPATVVVDPGDSLWRIAARALHRPTRTRVAAAWPQWWQTNRRVIGADPDLIHPGQRLVPPARPRRQS